MCLRRGACGVFVLCSVLGGCSEQEQAVPKGPAVIRIGVPEGDVSAPDVGISQIPPIFSVEGLLTRDYEGRVAPRLAKSWTSSPDGLTWRVFIRDDVTFHDGSKLTAQAVRDSLVTALARPGTRALYPGLQDVTEIVAEGDHEIVVRLKRRSALLLDDLEFPITKPSAAKEVPIGTGAFRVVSASKEEMSLESHKTYYQGQPRIDGITVHSYPTLRTAWASLMRQEIDILWDVAQDAVEFVGSNDVAMHSYLRPYNYLIAFNSARPKFATAPVRRAINAAIDRRALIRDVLKGHGQPASGPLWPHHWAYDASASTYTFDPSMAVATLDAAGLKRPRTDVGQIPARLSFVCLIPDKFLVLERLALNVQKQLYDVGIDMQLQAVSAEEYNVRIRKSDFDAIIVELISGPSLSRPYSFWRWGGESTAYNIFGYRNTAADKWFDAVRFAANDAEYRAAASQLQRTLHEDPPALFLAWSERTRAVSRRFNVNAEPGRDPMQRSWQWTPLNVRLNSTN